LFDKDVPMAEWIPYAKKFKAFCLEHIKIDPVVTADASRIMRCPETLNFKTDPPKRSDFISTDINLYDFESFKENLGVVESDPFDVLANGVEDIDPETASIGKYDANVEYDFDTIANLSLIDKGCLQIKYALENPKTVPYSLWRAVLSVAVRCSDGKEAIHLVSDEYPKYSKKETEEVANGTLQADWAYGCSAFGLENPDGCEGCIFAGKFGKAGPILIGKRIKEAPRAEVDTTEHIETVSKVPRFPESIRPYGRGMNGGVYYMPKPTLDKKSGDLVKEDPVLLTPYDLYPVKRMYSALDGECLLMHHDTPHDGDREFIVPMKLTHSPDEFKKLLTTYGVFFSSKIGNHFIEYTVKWGQYMFKANKAELMRMQMGWTESYDAFVIGNIEITPDGKERPAPSSPFVRGLAKLLVPTGSYALWQDAANALNEPGFETHAFGMFLGLGSTLMTFTSTSGVNVSFMGKSGTGKTGSLYAALSMFGNPKELSIFDATDNGMIGRYLGLHNLLLGYDEVSNKDGKQVSNSIHRVSNGKAKIRMQASVNAEREHELSAAMISFYTTNHSLQDKVTAHKNSPDGEMARLVEFDIKMPRPLEINPAKAKIIFDAFRINYGHAGPIFIKHVYNVGFDYAKGMIAKWSARFIKDFGHDAAYRFYDNLVGVTFGAAELAVEAGIFTFDLDRIYTRVVSEMCAIRDNVKLNRTDYGEVIATFFHRHQNGFLILDEGRVADEPKGPLVGRIEVHTQMQYVSAKLFGEHLAALNISKRDFTINAEAEGLLVFKDKQRLSNGWKSGMQTSPVAVYGFRIPISEDLLIKVKNEN
jgi:hypothetical protein